LIVFAIFFIARMMKRTMRKLTRDRRQVRNFGLGLGRLAQGTRMLVGLFMFSLIVIPSLQANDLVQ
jgi:ABC-type phosphate transport system permease subunit